MHSILTPSSSIANAFTSLSFPDFNSFCTNRKFRINYSKKSQNAVKIRAKFPNCGFSRTENKELRTPNSEDNNLLKCVAKPLALSLFCIAIGLCPVHRLQLPAVAATATAAAGERVSWRERIWGKRGKGNEGERLVWKQHEYSEYTHNLLDKVSVVIRKIEDVRISKGNVEEVEAALKEVKTAKEDFKDEILNALNVELRELKREKAPFEKRSEEIVEIAAGLNWEMEGLVRKRGRKEDVKDRVAKLEEKMRDVEVEYNEVSERIGEIDDRILRRETMALSVGVRELNFIEHECGLLVERFKQDFRRASIDSKPMTSATRLSRSEIQNDLETAQREYWVQMILPKVMEVENFGPLFDHDLKNFVINIKQALKASGELQSNLEGNIRKKMKRHGDEKRFVVSTPANEVIKGFPEVELKWMFGDKEVVVPKAIRIHLYNGWKKWREDAKADLKRNLLENIELGKQYVARRQERILLDRDRIVSKTWYNEERNRWEMDPLAVPHAVSKRLVENARIRHDWGAMFVALKGDDREYYVDIKEFEVLFEDFGGFDGLYLKMLASGIPTAVHLMWIPFSELDIHQQFLLTLRLLHQTSSGIWKTKIVSYAREWIIEKIRHINDDIMTMIVFPAVEFIIPYPVRMRLGMAWPEEVDQSVGSTWYLKWQSEAEMSFKSRKTDDIQWYIKFLIRSIIYGSVLFYMFHFLKRKVPRFFGYGPLRRDPNWRKLKRVKAYFRFRMRRIRRKKKDGIDPIRTAFDQMKRVKNPPIRLKDFASVDSMKEEINEVVAFLQNPSAFEKMGARAPRGVLIVGERGTGKTSLALAIAAEARVPVVEVKAQQLEAGLWVGQSASNVRELFQAARDLAPVIIFVEDFDLFAGVRGKFIHTKKQDHEAFINQLLVELDGFRLPARPSVSFGLPFLSECAIGNTRFEKQDGVVLMATTRNLKQIDQALRRPGRMDRVFHLQRPTQLEREKILRIAAKETMDNDLIDFVDWGKVAEKTALLRPIELKLVPMALEGSAFRSKFLDADELLSYCSWYATFGGIMPSWVRKTPIVKKINKMVVNHLGLTLTKEDFQNVVDLMEPYGQISNGIELLNPPLDWTRETKFPHAVWAAGRGLIALLLPNFDVVDNLWLEPLSWEGIGCTKITKAKNEGSMYGNVETRSYLEKKLVFCFGSHVAGQLLLPFGEDNFLSNSELKQAQEIATRMVIQYGWGPDDSPAIYYCNNAATALSMGDNQEYEIAEKVEKMYDLAYDRAREMLQKNRKVLEIIVEELLEFEILTGKDLERILESHGTVQEQEPFFLSKASSEVMVPSSFLDSGNGSGTPLLGAAT
ncbi:ATPase, AAA-type, core [Dillenia turbinata]|uniref:ATPase, AAA-type, core n=1 Tax=Dillenia turbinata TaxID=194707 RepID=A0AAN8USS7_9MAGN